MIVRVLMIRLPDDTAAAKGWTLADAEELRVNAPTILAGVGMPPARLQQVETLEPGYCQLNEVQWQQYRNLYTVNCHRDQA